MVPPRPQSCQGCAAAALLPFSCVKHPPHPLQVVGPNHPPSGVEASLDVQCATPNIRGRFGVLNDRVLLGTS